jgi:hypothetical protein
MKKLVARILAGVAPSAVTIAAAHAAMASMINEFAGTP